MKHIIYILLFLLASCSTAKQTNKDSRITHSTVDSNSLSNDETIMVEWNYNGNFDSDLLIPYNVDSCKGKTKSTNKKGNLIPPAKKGYIKITKSKKENLAETKKSEEEVKSENKISKSEKTKDKQRKVLKLRWWEIAINCIVAFIICFLVKKWQIPKKILNFICPNRK